MRLNLGSVAGNMPIAYFPSSAAHTQLIAPYYNEDQLISSLATFESTDDDELYEVTARAQAALLHWQNEFYDLDDQIWRATWGAYKREPLPRLLPLDVGQFTAETAQSHHTQPTEFAKFDRDDLTNTMLGAPNVLEQLPAKRQRKQRQPFEGGDESTRSVKLNSAPVEIVKKRKRQEPDVVESIENDAQQPAKKRATRAPKIKKEESEDPEPPIRRSTRARSIAKPESVAPEPPIHRSIRAKSITKAPSMAPESTTNRVSKTPAAANKRSTRAKSATKEPSAAPEVCQKGGKDPKRSAAMKTAWAKRQAEGRNGRHGGAPLASTVAKTVSKSGGK